MRVTAPELQLFVAEGVFKEKGGLRIFAGSISTFKYRQPVHLFFNPPWTQPLWKGWGVQEVIRDFPSEPTSSFYGATVRRGEAAPGAHTVAALRREPSGRISKSRGRLKPPRNYNRTAGAVKAGALSTGH